MFQSIDFYSANRLIDYLSPLSKTLWPRGQFVFRGQPCSTYELIPSTLRDTGKMALSNVITTEYKNGEILQVFFEIQILRAFLKGCDASGVSIPGDSPQVRAEIDSLRWELVDLSRGERWPPPTLYPVLAAAQHHGVPTCLLDWSRRSYVAAYFAASAALHDPPKSGQIAIWALDLSQYSLLGDLDLGLVEVPGGTSPNLAAQDGVFTVSIRRDHTRNKSEIIALEKKAESLSLPKSEDALPLFLKFTLPFDEASNLLTLCADLGVKGSTMFPGFEGVAREIKDNAFSGTLNKSLWL